MTQGPYHLISIGILLILSYLLSQQMLRMGLFSKQVHRKAWNLLLLLFFASTALLGLLLAVKVNYKLEIPWIEGALLWHVDLGIGFAFVALFHLTWHLKYYLKPASRTPDTEPESKGLAPIPLSGRQHKLLFLLLGYVSILSQLILLREFIKTLHGNELVIGIFLSLWMILSSAGAWAGARYKQQLSLRALLRLLLMLGTSPLLIYLLLILVDRFVFLPGYEPGTLSSIIYIILFISTFTLTSGFLFSYLARVIHSGIPDARNYLLESLGSLLGGVLFALVLVFAFNNIQIISILLLSCLLGVVLGFDYPDSRTKKLLLILPGCGLFILLSFPSVRMALEGVRFKNEQVLESRDTPLGNITLTERDGQISAYMDRNPVMYSEDLARSEECIHFPGLQRPDPSSFLLMGGGLTGNISEVQKYHPGIFDYCDADPWLYRLGKIYLPPASEENLRFIPLDGRRWLMKGKAPLYDVIISTAPDPYTLGWNRFYTQEFFKLVKKHLAPGGVFSMQLSAGGNYVNEEGMDQLNISYETLKTQFEYVLVVPGQVSTFLASDQALSLDFPSLLEQQQIQTTYVHPDFFDAMSLTFDSDMLMDRMDPESVGINRDMWPRLFFSSLASRESRLGGQALMASGIVAVFLFVLLLFLFPPRYTGMYVAGFTGAGIQILIIFVLQSLYGFAYMMAPLMITLFMAGIVLGVRVWKPIWQSPSRPKITALLWSMAILDAAALLLVKQLLPETAPLLGQVLLGLLNILPGMIVGSVYAMSVQLSIQNDGADSGRLYGADLAGAALGSFVPVVFVLPLIGIANTFILFCVINVLTGVYLLIRWQR
jgi:spermidine synthase